MLLSFHPFSLVQLEVNALNLSVYSYKKGQMCSGVCLWEHLCPLACGSYAVAVGA